MASGGDFEEDVEKRGGNKRSGRKEGERRKVGVDSGVREEE